MTSEIHVHISGFKLIDELNCFHTLGSTYPHCIKEIGSGASTHEKVGAKGAKIFLYIFIQPPPHKQDVT